ncbi:MAG: DUF488 domain-containing protein [Bacteroidales bacterium]|nr:DUF488 domain-containing protein [Bacteroidales bacterium]
MVATLFTIGFSKKNAEQFFGLIKSNNVKLVIDIRLNNVSQLAGFTKRDDLKYFLKYLCDCDYMHKPTWAPTKDILDNYKTKVIDWDTYVKKFKLLIEHRAIQSDVSLKQLDHACLLCSESTAAKCHRRLIAEHLQSFNKGALVVNHL